MPEMTSWPPAENIAENRSLSSHSSVDFYAMDTARQNTAVDTSSVLNYAQSHLQHQHQIHHQSNHGIGTNQPQQRSQRRRQRKIKDIGKPSVVSAPPPNTPLSNRQHVPADCSSSASIDEPAVTLIQIQNNIADISHAITSHELKRECIGIWTVYITVIDRVCFYLLIEIFFDVEIFKTFSR